MKHAMPNMSCIAARQSGLFPALTSDAHWVSHSLSHHLSQVALAHLSVSFAGLSSALKQNCDCPEHNRDNYTRHLPRHTIKVAKLVEGPYSSLG